MEFRFVAAKRIFRFEVQRLSVLGQSSGEIIERILKKQGILIHAHIARTNRACRRLLLFYVVGRLLMMRSLFLVVVVRARASVMGTFTCMEANEGQ
jgi:hypothetical protein